MRFIIFSEFGEILDLATRLKREGHEVVMHIQDGDYGRIGDGIIEKEKSWWRCLGKNYVWIFDGCENGNLQDWLRSRGEAVFGGTEFADKLENDRQLGQAFFRKAGYQQPKSRNFKDFESAIEYTKSSPSRLILKQNGNAPKSINHMGKFEDRTDMLLHLAELKNKWNVSEYGPVDFDMMEIVDGLELAASAFFNGKDWVRNKEGKVVGYINFEDKKETNGNTGETTGEMGTTFIGVTEDNKLFSDIILRPEVTKLLKKIDYRGVFDINCIKTEKGLVALEPTCRFGVPATSYEFIEGLESNTGELIDSIARGIKKPVQVRQGVGMVMVIAAKPYPVEGHLDSKHTSIGEKLWILKDGKPVEDFDEEQQKHIHLENFEKTESGYRVATNNGYLLTVTGVGRNIADTRDMLIEYVKENLYISGMKYRTDIGRRVEEFTGASLSNEARVSKIKEEYEKKIEEVKEEAETKHKKQMEGIKRYLKEAVYGNPG